MELSWWTSRGARAAVCALVLLLAWATPGSAAEPVLSIAAPEEIAVEAGAREPVTVLLRNDGPRELVVTFSVDVASGEVAPRVRPARRFVAPFGFTRVPLRFYGPGAETAGRGDLLVSTTPASPPASIPVAVTSESGLPDWVEGIVLVTLLVAALLIALVWARFRWLVRDTVKRPRLYLGAANWSFSDSWATNLTVLGGLLGTVVSAGVLPEDADPSKSTYAALSMLFAALILIGPFLYSTLQRRGPDDERGGLTYIGTTTGFLLATGIMLWAVLGQLATTYAIVDALRDADAVPALVRDVYGGIAGVSSLLVLLYAWLRTEHLLSASAEARGAVEAKRWTRPVRNIVPDSAPPTWNVF